MKENDISKNEKAKEQIYQVRRLIQDPFLNFILDRNINPIIVWALTSCIFLLIYLVMALKFGYFESKGNYIGFVEDYGVFINFTVGTPAIIVFHIQLSKYLDNCFNYLLVNGVFKKPTEAAIKRFSTKDNVYSLEVFFEEQMKNSITKNRWAFFSFIVSAIFIITTYHLRLDAKTWVSANISSFIVSEIIWFILFGVTALFGFRILNTIWWINESFKRFNINVRPLFPDGAGGLQPLSRFSIQLGYMLSVFGVELVLNQIQTGYIRTGNLGVITWEFDTIFVWIIYFVLAPILFFAPIGAAHDAMLEAKNRELLNFSKQFEKDYDDLRNNLNLGAKEVEGRIKKITELRKLYDMVKTFPVWPFQLQKFAQFSATIASPLLLAILTDVVTRFIATLFSSNP